MKLSDKQQDKLVLLIFIVILGLSFWLYWPIAVGLITILIFLIIIVD